MLFFNALTKLGAVTFGVVAMLVAPEQFTEDRSYDDGLYESSDPQLDLTDEVTPSEASRWECWDWDDVRPRGHCLARCDDGWSYHRVTDKIRVRGNRDFCKRKAQQYCKRRNDKLERSCFGERDWDDDDDWGR